VYGYRKKLKKDRLLSGKNLAVRPQELSEFSVRMVPMY
jgi:hypothetical protein